MSPNLRSVTARGVPPGWSSISVAARMASWNLKRQVRACGAEGKEESMMLRRGAMLLASGMAWATVTAQAQDWPVYTGDLAGTRYSAAAEITPGNLDRLKLAW